MNYIEQLNGFWDKPENIDLSGLDISVYMALLNYCNRLGWMNPFICHWDIICQSSKVSKNAYYKSLENLSKLGYIQYQKGVKNTASKPKIFILELKNKEGITKEQRGNKEGITKEQTEEQKGNLYKLLNIKQLNYKQLNSIVSFFDSNFSSDEIDNVLQEIKIMFSKTNDDEINFSFEDFWNAYDKKVGKKEKLELKWRRLSDEEREKIMEHIPKYKMSQPDKSYRKNPETFLNNKSWNDEIIFKNNQGVVDDIVRKEHDWRAVEAKFM